jgi:NAD-specific glutamate dehydrogenase
MRLINIKKTLAQETVPLERIYAIVKKNLKLCEDLYIDFSRRMRGAWPGYVYPDIHQAIKSVSDPLEQEILNTFHMFNESILKTNFYKTPKSAICFSFDPEKILKRHKVPEIPFGIFMIFGRDFTGFHIRFRDISRGGVRLIKSNYDNYAHNRIT